jgi:hypothetical protein
VRLSASLPFPQNPPKEKERWKWPFCGDALCQLPVPQAICPRRKKDGNSASLVRLSASLRFPQNPPKEKERWKWPLCGDALCQLALPQAIRPRRKKDGNGTSLTRLSASLRFPTGIRPRRKKDGNGLSLAMRSAGLRFPSQSAKGERKMEMAPLW